MFYKKLSLVTGGFDPIHSGHISYFARAKDFSDFLVVGINTEEWLTKKKGQYFQSWKERAEIIRHLRMVDAVITVPDDDKDLDTIINALALGGDTRLYHLLRNIKEDRKLRQQTEK